MNDLEDVRVAVLATDGFESSELLEPVQALRQARAKVDIISDHEGEIQGVQHMEKGARVMVDRVVNHAMASEYQALMLPGGAMNADKLRMDPEVQVFIQKFVQANKPIAAICHAPWELVSAGVVEGRTLTSYHTIQDDIRNAGGKWEDQEVVKDGNWVTSRQPSDLPAFNKAMIRLFDTAMQQAPQPLQR